MNDADPPDRLRASRRKLDPALHDEIIGLGMSRITDLAAVAEQRLSNPNGWSPLHAVDLLVELRASSGANSRKC